MDVKRVKTIAPWVEQIIVRDAVATYMSSGEWQVFVPIEKPEVVQVLADLGGQWRGGYWYFAKNPKAAIRNGQYEMPRWSFFPCPSYVANRLCEIADLTPGATVLEPSAGTGHLARALKAMWPEAHLQVNEYHHLRREELIAQGFELAPNAGDFLKFPRGEPTWDIIVQNPPYLDWQWVSHVYKAFALATRKSVHLLSARGLDSLSEQADAFRWWLHGKRVEIHELGEHIFQGGEYETSPIPLIALVLYRSEPNVTLPDFSL